MSTIVKGRVSSFGGPRDMGVKPQEGLAIINDRASLYKSVRPLFCTDEEFDWLAANPDLETGLARQLNPYMPYIAMRWAYSKSFAKKQEHRDLVPIITPKQFLLKTTVKVTNSKTGQWCGARPVDWGPNERTGRVADVSPGIMRFLGLATDDIVVVEIF